MDLFPNDDSLLPFIFRIVDNGGETYDRITVALCDGDAMLCSAYTVCTTVEADQGLMRDAEEVEAGIIRDLRWIDLDPTLQAGIRGALNLGYRDWLEAFTPPVSRDDAQDYGSALRLSEWAGVGVYGVPGAYHIRNDWRGVDPAESDYGPYDDLAAAVRGSLPDPGYLAGEEYHSTRDIAGTDGGPAPYWNREEEPPVVDENSEYARAVIVEEIADPAAPTGFRTERVAWFPTKADAENFLGTSAGIDQDKLHDGRYTIDDLDDPDAE